MKKALLSLLIIFCIQLVANAQAAERIVFPREKPKGPMMGGAKKITFPPRVFVKQNGKAVTSVVGITDNGVVIEDEKGEKMLVTADNNVIPLEATSTWTPVKPKPNENNVKVILIGTTDNGTLVWENSNGKNCTIDIKTGQMVDYIGHVTLLR
jgi:hypothetical protein